MSKRVRHAVAILTLVLAAAAAPGQGQTRWQALFAERFRDRDRNGDGQLTREEARPQDPFDQWDANRDGNVSEAEFREAMVARRAAQSRQRDGEPLSWEPDTAFARASSGGPLVPLLARRGLDATLVVSNLKRSLRFYRDGLGMKADAVQTATNGSRVVRLRLGVSVLELHAPERPVAPQPELAPDLRRYAYASHYGYGLLVFRLLDVAAARERLVGQGVEETTVRGLPAVAGLFLDPDGNAVALRDAGAVEVVDLGVVVADAERVGAFMEAVLGLPRAGGQRSPQSGGRELRFAAGDSEVRVISVAREVRPQGVPGEGTAGIRELVFSVTDAVAAHAILEDGGAEVWTEPDESLRLVDPEGNRIRLVPVRAGTSAAGGAGR